MSYTAPRFLKRHAVNSGPSTGGVQPQNGGGLVRRRLHKRRRRRTVIARAGVASRRPAARLPRRRARRHKAQYKHGNCNQNHPFSRPCHGNPPCIRRPSSDRPICTLSPPVIYSVHRRTAPVHYSTATGLLQFSISGNIKLQRGGELLRPPAPAVPMCNSFAARIRPRGGSILQNHHGAQNFAHRMQRLLPLEKQPQ